MESPCSPMKSQKKSLSPSRIPEINNDFSMYEQTEKAPTTIVSPTKPAKLWWNKPPKKKLAIQL